VGILRKGGRSFEGRADRTALAGVPQNVPSDSKEAQVRLGKHKRRRMNCCVRTEVAGLRAHCHGGTAAGADQACTGAPPRSRRQSPRFPVIQAQAVGVYIPMILGLVAVLECVVPYEPAMTLQYVAEAAFVGIRTLSQKGEYRRESRLGTASQHARIRLGFPTSR
jgi:hypothetical protein